MEALFILLVYAFAVASISFTITITSIFEPFRDWVSKLHPKVDELFHCPYCLGHYITILVILLTNNPLRVTDYSTINIVFTMFIIMGMVGVIHHILLRAYEPVIKLKMHRELQKKRLEQDSI